MVKGDTPILYRIPNSIANPMNAQLNNIRIVVSIILKWLLLFLYTFFSKKSILPINKSRRIKMPSIPKNMTVFPSDEPSSSGHKRFVTSESMLSVTNMINAKKSNKIAINNLNFSFSNIPLLISTLITSYLLCLFDYNIILIIFHIKIYLI